MPLSDPTAVSLFIEQSRRVLLGLDPEQVRIEPQRFVDMCLKFSAACCTAKVPLSAVRPLQHAL